MYAVGKSPCLMVYPLLAAKATMVLIVTASATGAYFCSAAWSDICRDPSTTHRLLHIDPRLVFLILYLRKPFNTVIPGFMGSRVYVPFFLRVSFSFSILSAQSRSVKACFQFLGVSGSRVSLAA